MKYPKTFTTPSGHTFTVDNHPEDYGMKFIVQITTAADELIILESCNEPRIFTGGYHKNFNKELNEVQKTWSENLKLDPSETPFSTSTPLTFKWIISE